MKPLPAYLGEFTFWLNEGNGVVDMPLRLGTLVARMQGKYRTCETLTAVAPWQCAYRSAAA